MAGNEVKYYVRIDDKYVEADISNAESKVSKSSSKFAGAAKTAGLAIGGAFVAATAATIKFGSEFEQGLANASTLIDTSVTDMDGLQQKLLDLSDSSGIAASELTGSLYTALSSGVPATEDMSEAMGFLEKSTKLAKSGFTDVDTAVSTTSKVLNAYNMDVSETDKVHKILMQTQNKGITTVGELGSVLANVTPTASAMGVSFEQVGAALATMTAAGTPAATATTQLNNLIAELGKKGTTAAKNLDAATKGTKYAGMSFTDLQAAGVPLNEVLDLMGDYADANGISMIDMFSSIEAGKAALSLAGENSAKFTENLSAMGTQVDVVGDAYDKVTETSGEQFSRLLNELKNIAIDLFDQMGPLIDEALPILKDLLDQIVPLFMDLTGEIMPILVDLFELLLPPLMDLVDQVLPPLVDLFNQLLPPLMGLLEAILPPLIDVFNILLEPLLDLIDELLPPLLELFDKLKPAIEALSPVISFLANLLSGALGSAINLISPLIEGLADILGGLLDFITGVFTGDWDKAWSGLVSIFTGIFNMIPAAVEGVINGAIGLINGILKGINKVAGSIGLPEVPLINKVELPRFHTGGIVDLPGGEGPALLKSGEMVLTKEQQAQLFALANGQFDALRYVNDNVDTDTAIETGDLLCSAAGKKPISGLRKSLTRANLELMAQNRGSGWHLENIKATAANQLLMIIELGMMNTQVGIGQGVVSITDNTAYNSSSLTGSTAALGNGTGQASETINEIGGVETVYTANGKTSITYRGQENPWGNIWKHIQGINIWGDGSMGGGQPFICANFTFNESKHSDNYVGAGFTLANAHGYISAMGYSTGCDWLFLPSETLGNTNLPVGDRVSAAINLNGYSATILGGYLSSGVNAGGFCWNLAYYAGFRDRASGGRLVYVPTATPH